MTDEIAALIAEAKRLLEVMEAGSDWPIAVAFEVVSELVAALEQATA